MKKILIAIFCIVILSATNTSVSADMVEKECTAEDFETNYMGCQDYYRDGMQEKQCTDYQYTMSIGGCRKTYLFDDSLEEPDRTEKEEQSLPIDVLNEKLCTLIDFTKGYYGCNDNNGACTLNEFKNGTNGCKYKYKIGTDKITDNEANEGDWWDLAGGFLSGYNGTDTAIGNTKVSDLLKFIDPIVDLVKVIGNMVFVAVTVILGVKYIWGSVESKASVKDSLLTLVVAALVFYGWNTISALFMTGNNISFIGGTVEDTALTVYSTILYICNFLAVGGLVYIGIRYMMAGAEGKAQLKAKGVPIVLGVIMVYATLTFLNFIVGIL